MKRKLLALLLCTSIFVGGTIASAEETQEITQPGSAQATVTYSQSANFSVIIAKEIVLDETKSATYKVRVVGDLASDDHVRVTPKDDVDTIDGINFIMSDQAEVDDKKEDVAATVTQDKTEWDFSNVNTDANGLITAEDLSAGNWKGLLTYEIEISRDGDDNP